jgi:hypothetical protein
MFGREQMCQAARFILRNPSRGASVIQFAGRTLIAPTFRLVLIFCAVAVADSANPSEPAAQSLPPTNFSAADIDRSALPRAAPGFVRATVASNPQAPDATPIGEKTCIACHRLEVEHFTHTLHALGLHVANRSDPTIPVCETCHGPGSEHAAQPLVKGLIIGYTHDSGTPIATQTKTCLTCHAGGPRDHWLGSVHQRNDLSCSDCHNPMAKFSVEGLMAKGSINDTCAQCHKDIRPAVLIVAGHSSTGTPFAEGNSRREAHLTNIRTGEEIRLGSPTSSSWAPNWSPDGQRVAIYSDEGGSAALWILDTATQKAERFRGVIVRPFFGWEIPRWSADGQSVLCKALPAAMSISEANALSPLLRTARQFPKHDDGAPGRPERVLRTPIVWCARRSRTRLVFCG